MLVNEGKVSFPISRRRNNGEEAIVGDELAINISSLRSQQEYRSRFF